MQNTDAIQPDPNGTSDYRQRDLVPPEMTIQHASTKGLRYILLHDRRKIYNKLLQYLAMHYLMPPQFRVKLQALRGVRFDDPRSVFLGDHINFDERLPENIRMGRAVWMAAGCRILTHRFLSWRFVEKSHVVFEDYVRVGANSMIIGPATIGKGAAIAPGAVVLKDVAPYTVVGGVPAKRIGVVPKDMVDYELLMEGDFKTGADLIQGYLWRAKPQEEDPVQRDA
ncbi:MAG: acyltransferase [bacterium]